MDRAYFNMASSTVLATAAVFVSLQSTPKELMEVPPMFEGSNRHFSNLDETNSSISNWLTAGLRERPVADSGLSIKWLADNRANFRGKWVVLIGDYLIGSGDNPKLIVENARKMRAETPFVAFVEEASAPVWSGLL